MAFDQTLFDPSIYQGGMSRWLQDAIGAGLLRGVSIPQQQPQQSIPLPQPRPTNAYASEPAAAPQPNYPSGELAMGPIQNLDQAAPGGLASFLPSRREEAQNKLAEAEQKAAALAQLRGDASQGTPQAPASHLYPQQNFFGRLAANMSPGWSAVQRQEQTAEATYQALKAAGVPDATARAAALNPQLLQTVAPNVLGTKVQFGVIGTDQYGNPVHGFINPQSQTVSPVSAQGAQSPQTAGDMSTTGEAFLKTLPPGRAETVRGIAEGRIPYPSGFIMKTPYGQWLQAAIAQYEPGVDATTIGRRSAFNKQLGSASPSSVGGQKTLMGTSLGHLAEVAETAADLGNYNTPFALVGRAINAGKNLSTEQAQKLNKLAETVDRFSGEVGKLYSGAQGGGVAERDQTRARFSGNMTSAELRGALEASRDLIKSKLAALENQQDEIFGPDSKARIDFLGKSGREALAKIDAAIGKLKGHETPSNKFKPPENWQYSQSRQQFRDPQGNIYDLNGNPVK